MYVYVYDLGLFLRRKFSYIERAVEIFQKRVLIKLENIFLENVSADDRVYMLTKYFFLKIHISYMYVGNYIKYYF